MVEKPCTNPGSDSSSSILSSCGVTLTPRTLRTAGAQDLLDLFFDLLEVHELAVDGGEPDVRHLVEVSQPDHHHLADLPARNLDATRAPQLRLDVVDDRAQPLG